MPASSQKFLLGNFPRFNRRRDVRYQLRRTITPPAVYPFPRRMEYNPISSRVAVALLHIVKH
jgi:hypothetical protein